MKRLTFIFCLLTVICYVHAQPAFNKPHGLYKIPMLITISAQSPDSKIYYTTDGSEPTLNSTLYTRSFLIKSTTILRAAEFQDDTLASPIATCSYIYPNSVLEQPNNPVGYPSKWGKYATISGTAIADYEMDPEMTGNSVYAKKITDGFYTLPILSLVTDKDNLFNTQADEKTGGIYIFTGVPVSNYPGRGWERPVSAELFGGQKEYNLQVNCALTIHGHSSRFPEKNPKHSLRLKFKSDYGPGKLNYPLFGDEEGNVSKFNCIIIRSMSNDSWIYQGNGRGTSQYIKELWARLIQKKMGHPSTNGVYVHLFINGMYWGLYCISERINDDFCKTHFGGDKEDYDVVKMSEVNKRMEASDGSIDKWNEMVSLAEKAADNQYYFKLIGRNGEEPLLDVDNFIDYMLINQYSGNEDWDSHNWTAIRNRKRADKGFQFLVWDAECIFRNDNFNALNIYYN
ncbi:MAG: CotH kinase family protein [Bacteroidaceae bacterium]|nr:CotH kinase family protein [Bacteroidaceae bacterium]